jgi:hypothetical protein
VSFGRGGVGAALARAAGWLVEPASAPAEPSTFLDRPGTVPTRREREAETPAPIREARGGPMEHRARPMELRARPMELRLVTSRVGAEPVKALEFPVPPVGLPVSPVERPSRPLELPPRSVELPARPIVAIVGLGPGCGATTLARALAGELARRDHSGAAIVASPEESFGSNLSTRAATRLAARIASGHSPARAAGRLCLTGAADPAALANSIARLAPLVLDLPPSDAAAASLAHVAIVIAAGDSEPALADLAARTLAAGARHPLTVVSGAHDQRWEQRAFLVLPRSRLGARLASAGWGPRGAFGAAVARIADACEEAACA